MAHRPERALRRRRRATAPLAGALGLASVIGITTGAPPAEATTVEPAREPRPTDRDRGTPSTGPGGPVSPVPAGASRETRPGERPDSDRSDRSDETRHRVVAGDTVIALAARYGTTVAAVVGANDLGPRALILIGQTLTIPGADTPAASPPAAAADSDADTDAPGGTYTVRPGDTVSAIASRHGSTVAAVVDANDLDARALIRIGQVLRIPGGAPSNPSSDAASSPSGPSTGDSSSATGPASSTYTVRSGDTVSGIAAQHGTTVAQVVGLNDLGGAAVIHPGQRLRVPEQLVPSTFLHYSYADDVVAAANENKRTLLARDVPDASSMQDLVRDVALEMGVDPALALAVAQQESGFDARAVSPANAVGAMQVIPSSGAWASDLVGRDLDLLDPRDNAVAGVAILRQLVRTAPDLPSAIAGYYQGAGSVSRNGVYADTRRYVASVQTLMTRFG